MAKKGSKKIAVNVEAEGNTLRAPETKEETNKAGLFEVLEQDEKTRRAKIERLKAQIASESYDVDSREVAESIINHTLESSKDNE